MSEYPNQDTIDNSYFKKLNEEEDLEIKKLKSVYADIKRIIAIGDIHGDFDALLKALYIGKVINIKGKWIGEETHVVQVGDLLDKGGRGFSNNSLNSTCCIMSSLWQSQPAQIFFPSVL